MEPPLSRRTRAWETCVEFVVLITIVHMPAGKLERAVLFCRLEQLDIYIHRFFVFVWDDNDAFAGGEVSGISEIDI